MRDQRYNDSRFLIVYNVTRRQWSHNFKVLKEKKKNRPGMNGASL